MATVLQCPQAVHADALPEPGALSQIFDYDPAQGRIFWPVDHPSRSGLEVGYIDAAGYRVAGIGRVKVRTQNVIWALETGAWPSLPLDHIDGDRLHNRFANLREVTHRENCLNRSLRSDNSSGVPGVGFHKHSGKWAARISDGKKRISLGFFDDLDAAIEARRIAELEHGYHPNHGRIA